MGRTRKEEIDMLKMEKEKNWEKQPLVDKKLELERLRIERQNTSFSASLASSPREHEDASSRRSLARSPKLPCFDDKQDQIDSYLLRFERYAAVCGWDKSDWAIHLSALLRGKALEVYTRPQEDEALDYDKCRDALLRRYNLTQDGFLEKFRNSRPEAGERRSQFRTRLQTYLDKWLHLPGKDKTRSEDIMDLFVVEPLINACGNNLVVFLKERKPKTSDDIVELAEKTIDARGQSGAYSKVSRDTKTVYNRPQASSHSKSRFAGVQCKKCHKFGHIERFCKSANAVSAVQLGSRPTCSLTVVD